MERTRLDDWRRGSRGFCGALTDGGGYNENQGKIIVPCTRGPLEVGRAIDGGDERRKTRDKSPGMSKKVGKGEREPTQGITFGAGH